MSHNAIRGDVAALGSSYFLIIIYMGIMLSTGPRPFNGLYESGHRLHRRNELYWCNGTWRLPRTDE